MESVGRNAITFIVVDLVGDFVFFPLWWYTGGFVRMLRRAKRWLDDVRVMMSIGVWVRNIFVPMFAQYDISGRLISFAVRLANIIGRSIALCIMAVLILLTVLIYIIIPPVLIALIFIQAFALFFG